MVTRPMANTAADVAIHQPRDPNTLSNYTAWRCGHITANLEIDFKGKKVWGNVLLAMKKVHGAAGRKVVLDTRLVSLVDLIDSSFLPGEK